jgi:type II secretory pathway pseudopilin PulG
MSETSSKKCNRCGAPMPPNSPEGLCPRCLVALNLATQTEVSGETGPHGTQIAKPPPAPPLPVEEVAKLFPQLEILECLGRGGMGAVYKARQPRLDRIVALKILSPEKQGEPKFAERFEREARALAKLHHPNIVAVYDFGEVQGNFYLLMEFVDGLTLRQLLQARKLSPAEALGIVPKICEALQYAHEQGIVHRDIKPENILLDKSGQVKIADFGIAKILGDGGRANLTAEQVIGTPHYMSPEQIEKPQTVDHRADIYSLGVVFYEMLTGELPLGKFSPPSKKVQIDVRLDEIVLRALEKEPERRYQQASEVKTQLETIANTEKPEARSQNSEIEPRFSRTAIAGAVCVPISLVPIFWFVAYVRQMTQTTTPTTHDTSWLNISLGIAGFMGLVLIAPLVTSVLGWTAVAQIHRSAGRIWGLKLAQFDGLFFPLLMLDGIIVGLWTVLQKMLAVFVWKVPGGNLFFSLWDFLVWLVLLAGIILWADSEIIRRVWRVVNRPPGNQPMASAPPIQKPDRFWRWFAVAVFALISIPFLISIVGLLAAIAIPNFIKARAKAQENARHAATQNHSFDLTTNFYIGQAWFPQGDSIEITSVERTKNQMTVEGHYNLVSHDKASLALYITTTNQGWTKTDSIQEKDISNGHGNFELTHPRVVPGLPHVSMYANGHPFASLYFGNKQEAAEEREARWIKNNSTRARAPKNNHATGLPMSPEKIDPNTGLPISSVGTTKINPATGLPMLPGQTEEINPNTGLPVTPNRPKIISVSPANGATNVDLVQELKIRFDQPMKPDDLAISFFSGGFLPDGQFHYDSAQNEFVIPLRLFPGQTNKLDVNWAKHGFRNTNSLAADEFRDWQFTTKSPAPKPNAAKPKVVEIFPKPGETLPVLTLFEITFDQPMLPPDQSLPYLRKIGIDVSDSPPVLIPCFDYDASARRFTIPVILPPDNETKLTLEGFKGANGVESEPVVISCVTGTNNFSQLQMNEMAAAAKDSRLEKLLSAMEIARDRLASGVETVQNIFTFGSEKSFDQNISSHSATFKWQGTNQFYADISGVMNSKAFILGDDGSNCWLYSESGNNERQLDSSPIADVADIYASIADPFGLTRHTVKFALKHDHLIYEEQTQLDGRACHHIESWFVEQSANELNGIGAEKMEWWIDTKTSLPARVVQYSQFGCEIYNFHYAKLGAPLPLAEFQPPVENAAGLKSDEWYDQKLGADEKRFLTIKDGSNGQMSGRIGRRGPNGTTSSGLN